MSGCTTGSATSSRRAATCSAEPFQPYIDELRRWQKRLNRVTELDEDPFSDPVDLSDIRAAAERMQMSSDKDWC